ncbi:putative motility protein YjfB-like [Kushneria sinocarnis]|uniref:Putative motility protein YjfB-like n=1 Tax=Kushneria sinocarnis TaxID=595502 RepID=A0A420WWQ4_9GAMM|nr:putative motility protein [Kushneria sinocarnis]RKR03530.1 putative motility protein YjfB-like [Kushneria sinocarnis]
MEMSVNATVSSALALQQVNSQQQAQAGLLKESLDAQAAQVGQLMAQVAPQPALATSGDVGTRLNTFA